MKNEASQLSVRKFDIPQRGSVAVRALESAWEELRRIESRIPPAVLTLVDAGSRWRVHGYFARSTWKKRRGSAHEIGISPELIGHPKDLLETMLHEAAHAVLHENGQRGGIGAGGYYHRKEFREECVRLGLKCEFLNSRYGFTLTSWPKGAVPVRYRPVLRLLREKLPAGTGAPRPQPSKGRALPPSGHTRLICACADRNRAIYVKKSVLQTGGICCRHCGEEFHPQDPT